MCNLTHQRFLIHPHKFLTQDMKTCQWNALLINSESPMCVKARTQSTFYEPKFELSTFPLCLQMISGLFVNTLLSESESVPLLHWPVSCSCVHVSPTRDLALYLFSSTEGITFGRNEGCFTNLWQGFRRN